MTTICIAGKNRIAVEALAYAHHHFAGRHEITCCITATDNGVNTWQPSLKHYAEKNAIRIRTATDCHGIKDLLFVSVEFDKILDPAKFESARLFNFHFSALPAYKGMYTSVWPILNDEKMSGVTLHKIDKGIDTGEIVDQTLFEIDAEDNSRDLYEKFLQNGIQLFKANLEKLVTGAETSTPQASAGSSYYAKSSIDYRAISINLNKTAYEIHNQIRAFAFRDYQLPVVHDRKVYESEITDIPSKGKAGTVVAGNEQWQLFNTIDYCIKIYTDRADELFSYAETGNLKGIRAIADSGYDIGIRNKKGWDIFIVAAYNNHCEILQFLLKMNWNINTQNYRGTTALMYSMTAAQLTGNSAAFDLLAEKADAGLQDDAGCDIFYYADQFENKDLLKRLKAYSAV